MKKLLLFSFIFCLAAGTAMSQISFGPKVGGNLSTYAQNFDDPDGEKYLKFRSGPIIGGVLDLPLCDFVSFQPSAQFSIKGTSTNMKKWSDESQNHEYEGYERVRIMYLEIPLNFAGKLELGPGTIQVFAGPYFAQAFSGRYIADYEKTMLDGSIEKTKSDEKIKFKSNIDQDDIVDGVKDYQRGLDFGINFGIGYQWNALLFNAGYAMGFTNLNPDRELEGYNPKDFKYSNRSIFFTAAWLFGGDN